LTFGTASGKVELFSSTLDKAKFPGYPAWDEPPAPAADQFYLITSKVGQHTQTGAQNNPLLNQVFDFQGLWLHPDAASKRGLNGNDPVRVTSTAGQVVVPVHITPAIRPDCVYLTPGFGHVSKGLRTAYGKGVSDSDLHVTFTDPVSGGQALSQTFVTVEKA
jgi:thiosulfate reductase/polysulfide reductase chain A